MRVAPLPPMLQKDEVLTATTKRSISPHHEIYANISTTGLKNT
jgi:hypothetical protein